MEKPTKLLDIRRIAAECDLVGRFASVLKAGPQESQDEAERLFVASGKQQDIGGPTD